MRSYDHEGPWKRGAVLVLVLLVSLVFLFAGMGKLVSGEPAAEQFRHWGYPAWLRYVVGLVEVGAAVMLVAPSTRFQSALALVVIMLGALVTHLLSAEYPMLLLPGVLLLATGFLAWRHRPRTM